MANRPDSFDINTPAGTSSPRQGDDELRKIKQYVQNGYNDMTRESGVGVNHVDLYGDTITADTGFVGDLTGEASAVADNAVNIEQLNTNTNSPGSNEVLGYDSANSRFEWVTNSGGDGVSSVFIDTSVPEVDGDTINSDSFSLAIPKNTGKYKLEIVDVDTDVTATSANTDLTVATVESIDVSFYLVEGESNNDPVLSDFTDNGVAIIYQYDDA